MRDKLVKVIIENEVANDVDERISTERFGMLSNEIVSIFPTEIKETYFSFSFKRKKDGTWAKIGSGKLYRKFYNNRRDMRHSGLLPSKLCSSQSNQTIPIGDADDNELAWLKNAVEPWTDVVRL
ncbi:hypothetical protein RN001_009530 [Aquatica leii]|uniref:Uncharacterized protein n=1 Tax=Aquatica leii TaxID=1421715 RepID=A0AAN7PTV1_9COLE|nr:hypothetical protein RN001_009530 [Aquatica leii]